jgi:hypothetical protein
MITVAEAAHPEGDPGLPVLRTGSLVLNPGDRPSRSPVGRRGVSPLPAPRRPNAAISLWQTPHQRDGPRLNPHRRKHARGFVQ